MNNNELKLVWQKFVRKKQSTSELLFLSVKTESNQIPRSFIFKTKFERISISIVLEKKLLKSTKKIFFSTHVVF